MPSRSDRMGEVDPPVPSLETDPDRRRLHDDFTTTSRRQRDGNRRACEIGRQPAATVGPCCAGRRCADPSWTMKLRRYTRGNEGPVEFGLLGPLKVVDGGRPVPIPSAKHRVMLACLLLRAGKLVTVDELAEAIW